MGHVNTSTPIIFYNSIDLYVREQFKNMLARATDCTVELLPCTGTYEITHNNVT